MISITHRGKSSVKKAQLTARYLKDADLLVERIESEVHRTGQRQRYPANSKKENVSYTNLNSAFFSFSPNAVEDFSVRKDPDVDVWHNDFVLSRFLLVAEERVRHPNLGRVR